MKRVLIGLFLLAAMVPSRGAAQVRVTPSTTSNTKAEREILDLSVAKWRWMAEGKVDSLAALLDEKSVFVHMGGTFNKTQELESIRSRGIVYKTVDIQDASVREIGETAIVLSRIRLVAIVGGNEVTNPFVVTEVYVRQGATRTLASLSFTRLLAP